MNTDDSVPHGDVVMKVTRKSESIAAACLTEREISYCSLDSARIPINFTNFWKWSSSWEADTHSVDHEISHHLRNPNILYALQESLLVLPILSQLNPIKTYLFKI
jgi:hypothetical protein